MPTAKLTSKGQVTIPREVRERLRLARGDRIEFVIGEDGTVTLRAARRDVMALAGVLKDARRRVLTVEEMNRIAGRGWAGELRE